MGALLVSGTYQNGACAWIRSRTRPPPPGIEVSLGKKRKILNRILSGSKNIRFDDFVALLLALGFVLDRVNGSHHVFSHPKIRRAFPIQPIQGKAKPYQMQQLVELIEQFNLRLAEESDTDPEEESP